MHYSIILFFFNDTATPDIHTLSLHDALPICVAARRHGTDAAHAGYSVPLRRAQRLQSGGERRRRGALPESAPGTVQRSEEHTSELQSLTNLVCRLLLEKKKMNK